MLFSNSSTDDVCGRTDQRTIAPETRPKRKRPNHRLQRQAQIRLLRQCHHNLHHHGRYRDAIDERRRQGRDPQYDDDRYRKPQILRHGQDDRFRRVPNPIDQSHPLDRFHQRKHGGKEQ